MNPIVSIIAAVARHKKTDQAVVVNAAPKKTPKRTKFIRANDDIVIGTNNTLPWHLPGDLRHFKSLTLGKPIIMGRRTFDSIGKPLPGRTNIVVTRNPDFHPKGVKVSASLEDALAIAREANSNEIFIIGGAQIYDQSIQMGVVKRMYLTEVDKDVEGDAFFPKFARRKWKETKRKSATPLFHKANNERFDFVCYERTED